MNYVCCFKKDNNCFWYRVGAFILENDCVLFVKNTTDDFYYSVGGGVHIGETAAEAIVREVLEETGLNYEIDHLCVIHENFFSQKEGNLKGLSCHEISLYYLMKSKNIKQINSDSYNSFGDKESIHFLPLSNLDDYTVYPSFIKANLDKIKKGLLHIVTKNNLDEVISPL